MNMPLSKAFPIIGSAMGSQVSDGPFSSPLTWFIPTPSKGPVPHVLARYPRRPAACYYGNPGSSRCVEIVHLSVSAGSGMPVLCISSQPDRFDPVILCPEFFFLWSPACVFKTICLTYYNCNLKCNLMIHIHFDPKSVKNKCPGPPLFPRPTRPQHPLYPVIRHPAVIPAPPGYAAPGIGGGCCNPVLCHFLLLLGLPIPIFPPHACWRAWYIYEGIVSIQRNYGPVFCPL